MTPTDEQRKAFRGACGPFGSRATELLADALRDTLAALMESEFKREHRCWLDWDTPCIDPRHNNSKADWQAAAEAVLREKS